MSRLILSLALSRTFTVALAKNPKVSSDLEEIPEGTSVDVVVQYKKSLGEQQIEKVKKGIGKAFGKPEKVKLHLIEGDARGHGTNSAVIQAALASNDVSPAGLVARSPVAYHDAATGEVLISIEFDEVCGDSALWGRTAVEGSGALWGRSSPWSLPVCRSWFPVR